MDEASEPRCAKCQEEGRPPIARGLCSRCYQALRYRGEELPPTRIEARDSEIEGERWLPVVGYEGHYEVSDFGRVRSPLGLRSQSVIAKGYRAVDLKVNGVRRTVRVHRLVLEAFVGPAPDGHVTCHGLGGPADNRLSNLRWDTRSENQLDITRHGKNPQVNRTHCPRQHPLAGANLKVSTLAAGRRECLACSRAKSLIRYAQNMGRPLPDLQELSDAKYADIIQGVA